MSVYHYPTRVCHPRKKRRTAQWHEVDEEFLPRCISEPCRRTDTEATIVTETHGLASAGKELEAYFQLVLPCPIVQFDWFDNI